MNTLVDRISTGLNTFGRYTSAFTAGLFSSIGFQAVFAQIV